MSRTTLAIFLLLAMLWQTVAWVTPHGVAQKSQEMAHIIVHVQVSDHHHHNDQSLHLEESLNEPTHQHPDESMQPAVLPPPLIAHLPTLLSWTPYVVINTAVPTIYLEGPLRPPRSLA